MFVLLDICGVTDPGGVCMDCSREILASIGDREDNHEFGLQACVLFCGAVFFPEYLKLLSTGDLEVSQ